MGKVSIPLIWSPDWNDSSGEENGWILGLIMAVVIAIVNIPWGTVLGALVI